MNLAHKGVRSSARRQQNLDMQQTYPGPKPLQVSFRQNLKYTYMRLNFTMVFTPFHSGNTIFDILKPLKNYPSRQKSRVNTRYNSGAEEILRAFNLLNSIVFRRI